MTIGGSHVAGRPAATRAQWSWALYDWANSAFATTVMAGFFPIFFKQYWSYGVDVNMSTAQLGFGNSIASLLVALMAPILGAIADKGSVKKKFLIFFAYLGVLMTAGLFMVHKGQWAMAIFVYVMGVIGFSGANVFYDAILPAITTEDRIDYVSSLGFSMGYLGGGLLFLINVLMTLIPQTFGLPDAAAPTRPGFILKEHSSGGPCIDIGVHILVVGVVMAVVVALAEADDEMQRRR